MNEKDKQAFEAAFKSNDWHSYEAIDIWKTALDYARGKQEPVAFCVEFSGDSLGRVQLGLPTTDRNEAEEIARLVPSKRRVVNLFREAPAVAVNEQLLEALRHLHHNAKKSGANMGVALYVAENAIRAAEAAKGAA